MKRMLVCNHKMFLTYDEAALLEKSIESINTTNVDLIICPSYLNMSLFKNYKLGAQDCFYEDKGPYTGSISAYQLSLLGVKYVILGHSERRCFDTDEIINLKVKSALKNYLTPILCIGETKMERDLNRASEVLKRQLKKGLKDISMDDDKEIIIAYEPRWAIGNNICLSKEEIEDYIKYIKKILLEMNITNYKLLYGGAITSLNIKELLNSKIDGFLIGNSSVVFNELNKIINCIK